MNAMDVLGIFACLCSLFMTLAQGSPSSVKAEYMRQREAIMYGDASLRAGATLRMSPDEHMVNNYILKEKREIMDESKKERKAYFPATSFFRSRSQMRKTKAYDVIKKMPKGGVLHLHSTALPGLEWMVKDATYRDHVWMCIDEDGILRLKRVQKAPDDPPCNWESVKEKREASNSSEKFDNWMIQNITLLAKDPLVAYQTGSEIWDRFEGYFNQVKLLKSVEVYRDYYRQALEQFYADNVQYVEIRGSMSGLYELDGTKHDTEFALKLMKSVTEEFQRKHPDFIGAKFIKSSPRMVPIERIKDDVKTAMKLHKKYPDWFIGYDLVAEEDRWESLLHYIDALLYPAQQDPPYKLPYFFHAGETKWQDTEVDYNLADAILLNATRIGHAYALLKHPKFMEVVKEKGIGLEVTPISNQLLGFLKDLRNHPMVSLLAGNYPIVIASDDPMTWQAAPVSDDFYVAFMVLSGRNTGLAQLKQLAMNSLNYTGMTETEKVTAKKKWQKRWDKFIKEAPKIAGDSSGYYTTEGPTAAPSAVDGSAALVIFSAQLIYSALAVATVLIFWSRG